MSAVQARSRTWTWHFDDPVETIWPILSDTARFNEAARLPKQRIEEIPREDGSMRYVARARRGPLRLAWEEDPVNWVHGQWMRHNRRFLHGPLESLCATLRMDSRDSDCRCEYTVDAVAANALGRALLATVFFPTIERTFAPLAEAARDFARGRRETEFPVRAPRLAPGGRERALAAARMVEESPHGHALARRLADLVLEREEVEVWSIRPLKLARRWKVPARHAIEVCLEAARQGLLALRWDLLCPRCQIGKASALALDELPTGAHCATCNIDYGRDYTDNVELVFHPSRSIRPVEHGEYCLFGPMSTPHILVQLTLAAGERRELGLALPTGSYRIRTLEPGPEEDIQHDGAAFPGVIAGPDGVHAAPGAVAGTIVLENRSARTLTLIVEERVWARDALTAKRACSLQGFRDLFTHEVLRPGDHLDIDRVTLMFTDLQGSTALYERIGDPQAYALVREHYAILGRAIREHDGAVVKTIGDAIMGAFSDPCDALRCAVQMHRDLDDYNGGSGREPIRIKLGLHVGRCIAVTLNNRLDYYGTAANLAARLQGQSQGGDIVMSREFAADPAVAALLREYDVEQGSAALKGFDGPVPFLRLPATALAGRRAARTTR